MTMVDDKAKVELRDPELDPDRFLMEGIEVGPPWFSVSEVGKFFFARSPHWIRWREEKGFFTLDGVAIGTTRTKKNVKGGAGQRRYNLADVEKIGHALAEKGAIDGNQLRRTLHLVESEARLWDYLA